MARKHQPETARKITHVTSSYLKVRASIRANPSTRGFPGRAVLGGAARLAPRNPRSAPARRATEQIAKVMSLIFLGYPRSPEPGRRGRFPSILLYFVVLIVFNYIKSKPRCYGCRSSRHSNC